MNTLQLIETKQINNVSVDGWYGTQQAWFTRFQIGEALEYDNPNDAIAKIHDRHRERLDKFSRLDSLSNEVQVYNVYLYSIRGVLEICRWSKQPKADMVMDALYDMATEVMAKGWYSTLPDNQLLNILSERLKENPKLISDTRLSQRNKYSFRVYEMEEQIRQLWEKRFEYDFDEYNRELVRICNYSTTRYNQEWRKYVRWALAYKKNKAEAIIHTESTNNPAPSISLKGVIPLSPLPLKTNDKG